MLKKSSVSVAKSRLKLLIVSDRISCSPAEYENISRDLFQTLSKYLELNSEITSSALFCLYLHYP